MALSSQKQVLTAMDIMAGRAMGRVAREHQRGAVSKIGERAKKAKSLKGLLRQLGPGLLREMDSKPLEKALADAEVVSGLIGRTSARPRQRR